MFDSIANATDNHPDAYLQEDAGDDDDDSLIYETGATASGKNNSRNGSLDLDLFADEEEKENENENEKASGRESSFFDKDCGSMAVRALIGLGIAGLGGTLVADVFGMFYVDCFLRAYRLPMRVFGIGSAIFAVINTANDVAGAYFCDWYASRSGKKRQDLVGLSGCLFAVSVLAPFFRWGPRDGNASEDIGVFWDGLHFVGSLSLYDTMFSFYCILLGSIISDNHSMTENQRIGFFALRDLVGIIAPLVVTKVALALFDVNDLRVFRIFVVVLVVVSSLLSCWGQALIHHDGNSAKTPHQDRKLFPALLSALGLSSGYSKVSHEVSRAGEIDTTGIDIDEGGIGSSRSSNTTTIEGVDNKNSNSNSNSNNTHRDRVRNENNRGSECSEGDINTESSNSKLVFWRVVSDFAAHPNFRYWIGMEMLMEGQNTFLGNFEKTFVDQLLRKDNDDDVEGWSNEACDWMLALLDPATQIVGLLLFLPIRRYGYARLYKVVFVTNILMALALLLSNGFYNSNHNISSIAAFLCLSIVLSNAMAGAGFGLAMCDMVLEMKHSHIVGQGRKNPPSLAGLFMGVNALFCKPAESVLPILTASFLGEDYNSNQDESNENTSAEARVVLYRLLVLPPLVCSMLQLVLWSKYSLVPETTEQLRTELKEHEEEEQQQQQQQRSSKNNINNSVRNIGIEMAASSATITVTRTPSPIP